MKIKNIFHYSNKCYFKINIFPLKNPNDSIWGQSENSEKAKTKYKPQGLLNGKPGTISKLVDSLKIIFEKINKYLTFKNLRFQQDLNLSVYQFILNMY